MISFPPEIFKPTGSEDFNPSIRLFGRRFSDDQQVVDLVAEFLLVFGSPKIAHNEFVGIFPSQAELTKWRNESAALKYFPKLHLNLKLFSFLSSSRLESRHKTHREHALELNESLASRVDLETQEEKSELLRMLSNLSLGFWGNGAERTWCAQTFYPFCKSVLSGEVIWNETEARKRDPMSWNDVTSQFTTFFDSSKHNFFARGGEALYLQLCNVLAQTKEEIADWLDESGLDGFTEDERDPQKLRESLEQGVASFFEATPSALEKVLRFIDTGVDADTAECSDFVNDHGRRVSRSVTCGWIPQESWREGFLFAVELKRIFAARLGVMETVDMLQVACAFQVMRSLAAQTYRNSKTEGGHKDGLDYRLLVCDPAASSQRIKDFSGKSLAEITREIQQVIRTPEMMKNVDDYCASKEGVRSNPKKIYTDADKYGYKLYRKIGKGVGFIVPPKGRYMRYTLNERILKYLVVSLVPGERMTLETFKQQLERHHGIVFDIDRLSLSRNWCERVDELRGGESANEFLERMLEAAGTLVRLSDSCSLVKNPYVEAER